jgi:hypothetical protein
MTELPLVAASEHDLLMVARMLLAPADHDVWLQLGRARAVPPAIGTTCAKLLEQTLRQTWPALWRRGGTRPDASLRDGKVVRGRTWERHPASELAFTAASVELLRWLVATSFTAPVSTIATLRERPLAIGDQVLIYLALEVTHDTPALAALVRQPMVRAAPLAWLGFAHLLAQPDLPFAPPFGGAARAGKAGPCDFDSLAHGTGAVVVETLAGELAQRWHTVELRKRELTDPAALVALGSGQDLALTQFQMACGWRKRRDLTSFILDAAAPSLARGLAPIPATLDATAPLSLRMQARLGAGALLRGVMRWCEWDLEHRGIRFIDDDYATAQLLLSRFEKIGAAGADRAAGWLSDLSALAPVS